MDRCGSYQADQWKTRIASGDIPDYIKTDAIGSGLHDIGAVRVLSEDYLRQHMPNYTKLVDQIAGPYGWQTVTSGGEVVGIPSVNVAIASGATFVTRRDWIEAVGEPIPDKRMLGSPYSDYSSLEDVERLLRKYRNEDPDGNGERDTYGLSVYKNSNTVSFNAGAQWAFPNEFGAHGVRLSSWQEAGGALQYSMISVGYKEALAFLRRWYEEEIIAPEFVTDKRSELITKFSNGIVGAFPASTAWTGPRPSGPTGVLLKNVPDTELVYFIAYEGRRRQSLDVKLQPGPRCGSGRFCSNCAGGRAGGLRGRQSTRWEARRCGWPRSAPLATAHRRLLRGRRVTVTREFR